MGSLVPSESQVDLEERFRRRLRDARLRIDFCEACVQKVEADAGLFLPSDNGYVYRRALRAESYALREFTRLLRIYSVLVLSGKVSDEELH